MSENDYKAYVEKFAKKHGITIEEAEKQAIMKDVKQYYEEDQTDTKKAGWSQQEV